MLEAAGRLWLAGSTLDWSAVHAERRRRVPLPTYPFERKRHSVERAVVRRRPRPRRPDRRRPGHEPPAAGGGIGCGLVRGSAPAPDSGACPGCRLAGARWLVFHDEAASSLALVDAWRSLGINVLSVLPGDGFVRDNGDQFRVRAGNPADIERVLHQAEADAPLPPWCTRGMRPARPTWAARRTSTRLGAWGSTACSTSVRPSPAGPATRCCRSSSSAPIANPCSARSRCGPSARCSLDPAYLLPIDLPRVLCRSIDLASADWGYPDFRDPGRADRGRGSPFRTGKSWSATDSATAGCR